MGIDGVYSSLLELFPEIDKRALRAVAIEHSKDADVAVEAVLMEIIPLFSETHKPSGPSNQSINVAEPSEALLGDVDCGNQHPVDGDYLNNPFHDASGGDNTAELTLLENNHESRIKMSPVVHSRGEPVVFIDLTTADTLPIEISGASETEETVSGDKFSEKNLSGRKTNLMQEGEDIVGHVDIGFGKVSNIENDATVRPLESSAELVEVPDMHESNLGKLEVSLSTDTAENESSMTASMSQSSQAHIMDVVEEIIAEARNNKKTLFSTMESVISLMRQVEHKEQDLERAKEEATVGGKHTLDKVEELKRMLQHAKEANDMHSGEVYGEKAILATELRELQSRVLSLSDERDTSLAILEEMRKTLDVRLAAVENEIQSAEQEKLEKEKAARKLLADQELIMEKIVQESKILKQQAEDNAKLQEFLVDRGRVVDMLQGEIAVICEDVRVLKEKFDEHVPLSKSLFSSQTSFILASSTSSSSKSLKTDQVEPLQPMGDDLSETLKEGDYEQGREEKAERDDRKALVDDGWEFFDEPEINA